MDVFGVAPRAHGNGEQKYAGCTRRCQYGASTLTMPGLGRTRLAGRSGAERCDGLDGMMLPVRRVHIPFAAASDRRGGVRWGGFASLSQAAA